MTVYLDNNIIVSIESGDYTLDDIINLLPNEKPIFFYSYAHIFEVENFKGSKEIDKDALTIQRFKTIRNVFQNNYLSLDLKNKEVTKRIEDPFDIYDTITLLPSAVNALKIFSNIFSDEQKNIFREQLDINMKTINNYSSEKIIEHLSTKLELWGTHQSFLEVIDLAIQLHPMGKSFGLYNRIPVVFDLLDMLGYWKDKATETSNYARLWDGTHTFFSTFCDFFISDDKRTRNKARVVYNIYKKDTQILSIKEY